MYTQDNQDQLDIQYIQDSDIKYKQDKQDKQYSSGHMGDRYQYTQDKLVLYTQDKLVLYTLGHFRYRYKDIQYNQDPK